jgi:hypothetical protein
MNRKSLTPLRGTIVRRHKISNVNGYALTRWENSVLDVTSQKLRGISRKFFYVKLPPKAVPSIGQILPRRPPDSRVSLQLRLRGGGK